MSKKIKKRALFFTSIDLRISFLFGIALVISTLFVIRLFSIQVLQHEKYEKRAKDQYWSLQEIPSSRGNILSSGGFSLASNQLSYLLFAQPKNIDDPLSVAHDIAKILTSDDGLSGPVSKNQSDSEKVEAEFEYLKNHFYEVLSLDLYWVVLQHNLTPQQKNMLEESGMKYIGFELEPERFYPEGTLAAHVLGFVADNENGQKQGYFGIEGEFDGDLRGKPGRIVQETDATGAPILVGGYKRVDPINGRDIFLTINRAIQYAVEKKLVEGVKSSGSVSGSVIVMDPFTGDIIAMANYPSYDPGNYNEIVSERDEDENSEFSKEESTEKTEKRNLAISETYEPGSVIKALTASAAIDLEKVNPNTTFFDSGPVTYSGYTIDNWDLKHHNLQTVIQLLQKSNNIGAVWLGHLVGSRKLRSYFSDFGLGEITGIGLEGEDTGFLRKYEEWTDIDLATAAFGQGVSATPLQVLNSFNVIANGGVLMQPRIVAKIVDNGQVIDIPNKKVRRVIKEQTSETMIDLLTQAVGGGESSYYNIDDYKVAGKTGTAQIFVDGEYDPTKTNATFVGFLPTSKKFSMIVRLDRPSTSPYAAETAVPLWMDIAEDLIRYYGVAPDK